jgi:hypothetical protein
MLDFEGKLRSAVADLLNDAQHPEKKHHPGWAAFGGHVAALSLYGG